MYNVNLIHQDKRLKDILKINQKYWKKINQKYWEKMISLRQRHENEPIVRFIKNQNKNELFLLPDPLFVSRMSRLGHGRELYDMRVMIRELENLERDYSKRLKEEMSGRKEQGTEMKDLVQPYFSCGIF